MVKKMMKKFLFIPVFLFTVALSYAQSVNDQLIAAVKLKSPDLVTKILKAGADANAVQANGTFRVDALILAVVNEDAETVRILVEHKADVNWRDGFGDTALMYAAHTGNTAIIGYLLDKGADIHAKDSHGNTVISAAKEGKHPEAIKLIQSRL